MRHRDSNHQHNTAGQDHSRWQARPVLSALLRATVLLVPLAAGVTTAAWVSHAISRPTGPAMLWWWAMVLGASLLAVRIVERLARRLLPLAVLLRLSLLFPDKAPSRFAMARTSGNVRILHQRIRDARERGVEDDPARAAETILSLVAALSAHDRKTRGHSERVRAFTDMLAESMQLPTFDRDRLRWGALLHDIGKLQVSGAILNKPGKPLPHEWEALKLHPEEGARLAAPLLPWLGYWGLSIVEHHERFDGGGYPSGLAGDQISMGGRMVTVADSFETMTAARSYKKPMSAAAARKELARCAGTQFDPAMVRAFLNISLGRLRWTMGPMAWLAQIPFLGEVQRATWQTVTATTNMAGVVTKTVAGMVALGLGGSVALPSRVVERPTPVAGQLAGVLAGQSSPSSEDRPVKSDDEGRPGDDGNRPHSGGEQPGGEEPDPGVDEDRDPLEDPKIDPDPTKEPRDKVNDTVHDLGGAVDDTVDDVTDEVDDLTDLPTDPVDDLVDGVTDILPDLPDLGL